MTLNTSEIVLIPYPYTDLSTTKRRPVLVLLPPDLHGDFLAAPITSQAGHADEMALTNADLVAGQWPRSSWVRTSRLFSLHESSVVRALGTIQPEAFARIRARICASLGCCP
jgi:mRNA interferase MazF